MGPAPLNYTTSIDAGKTAMECSALLAGHGAMEVGLSFGAGGIPKGLAFRIETPWGPRSYSLEANAEGTYQALLRARQARRIEPRWCTREQAARVAWRVLRDWLEAQLAIIASGMAGLHEVMFPWMTVRPGVTVMQAYESQQREITAGGGDGTA